MSDIALRRKRTVALGTIPVFSRDSQSLFYLRSESPERPTELWRVDVACGRNERALPGVTVLEFDLSDDAREVLYSSQRPGEAVKLWIAALSHRSPPRLIARFDGDSPYFGPDDRIVYRSSDGTNHYFVQMNRDGSGLSRIAPYPIGNTIAMSPDRRWIVTAGTIPDVGTGTFAVPIAGGAPRRICSGCPVAWALDGRSLYLSVQTSSLMNRGKTPVVPPVYAYVRTTMHRNLYSVPLR